MPTEARGKAPRLRVGERVQVGALEALLVGVDPVDFSLVRVRFDLEGAPLWSALYRAGRAISYAYHERASELWDVNHRFASRPGRAFARAP